MPITTILDCIASYDHASTFLLYDCKCYVEKYNEKELIELMRSKQSYFGCCAKSKGQVLHRKYPIMIGSLCDFHIRGQKMYENRDQFGAFIIRGEITVIPSFLTNNTNGLYTRKVFDERIAMFNFTSITNPNMMFSIKFKLPKNDTKRIKLDEEQPDEDEDDDEEEEELDIVDEEEEQHDFADDEESLSDIEIIEPEPYVPLNKKKRKYEEEQWDGIMFNLTVKKDDTLEREHEIPTEATILNELSSLYGKVGLKKTTLSSYIFVMEKMIKYPLELDSFSNKIILSPATMLSQCFNALSDDISKLDSVMKRGTFYFLLGSNGKTLKLNDNTVKTTLYITMSGSKQNNCAANLRIIKRKVDEPMKKTKALNFSDDSKGFICPLTSKELVGAGEMMEFAQYVTTTVPVSIKRVNKEASKFARKVESENDIRVDEYFLMFGDFIPFLCFPKHKLTELKKRLPFCPFFRHDNLLRINYTGNIPVKFSPNYKFFVSPHEREQFWPNAFDDYEPITNYGYTIQYMGKHFNRVPPAKATVFQANCKGSVAVFKEEDEDNLMKTIFKITGGYHMAMIKEEGADYLKFARVPELDVGQSNTPTQKQIDKSFKNCEAMIGKFKEFGFMNYSNDKVKTYKDYLSNEKYAEDTFTNYTNILLNFKRIRYMLKINGDPSCTIIESFPDFVASFETCGLFLPKITFKRKKVTVEEKKTKTKIVAKKDVVDLLKNFYGSLTEFFKKNTKDAYQIQLYASFGDLDGGTVEDGIIADVDFIKNSPNLYISSSSRVLVTKKKEVKLKKSEYEELKYNPINVVLDNQINYGTLTSKFRLEIKSNDNIKVRETCIRNTYIYTIYSTNYIENLQVTSFIFEDSIILNYNILSKIGIGIKLANTFGQKDVICKIADLKPFGGYNKKGEFIKPQLLYPPQSLIGRSVGSQYISAIESPHLVITRRSKFSNPLYNYNSDYSINEPAAFSKINVFIHNQGPLPKLQSTRAMKNDLWTNENGFRCNQLSSLPVAVERLQSKNKVNHKRNVRHVNEIFTLQGVVIEFAKTEECSSDEDSS